MRRGLRLGFVASCNEIYTTLKSSGNRFYLILVMLMMSGAMYGQYSYTFGSGPFTANNQTKTLSSVDWLLVNNGGFYGYDATKGQQIGSGGNPASTMSLSTSGISGTITSIKITTSGASSVVANVSCTVGGVAFGGAAQTITATSTVYTFNGSSSGAISINWTNSSAKALYFKKIEVTYSSGNTVTFNSNGGTGTMANQTASGTTNLTANTFTRTGYVFAGWATTSGGAVAYTDGASFPFAANTTLYAQWTPVYTLTYNGNGNTGGTVPTDSNTYAAAASATVLGNTGSLTRTGYTFAGWTVASDGSGTVYTAGNSFSIPAANTTLYAKWTINNYSVTYDGNGNTGGAAPAVQNGDYNTGITVANEGSLTQSGYTFEGWNTAANGSGDSYDPGDTYTVPASNGTLYAQWLSVGPSVGYTGSLTSFYTEYGTPSIEQSLTITGNNLTENLTLDMGSMFEYSTDGNTYTNTLSIAPSGGTVNATIYLRIKASVPPITTSVFGQLSSSGAIEFVNAFLVTVTTRNIFLLGVDADNKVYDGTTTAVLGGFPSLFGVVGSDSVSYTGPTTGTFNNANAGTNKTVTVSDYTLTGLHADRYNLWQPTTITADISRRTLAISDPTIAPKVYDGTTVTGTVTPGTLTGLLGSETLVVTGTGAYTDADAATGKFATVAYVLADGTNGGLATNYFLAIGPGTGDITKANQTITFGTLVDKTTADVPFTLTATASSGLPVTYSSSMPTVASVSGSTVTIGTSGTAIITASQAGNGNYNAATDVQQIQLVTDGPCVTETFVNSSATTSYASGSFAGNNGITWSYVGSRNQDTFGIDGNGLMFQNSSSSITATIPNPINKIKFKARKAFTSGSNNRQIEVLVNNVVVLTTATFSTSGTDTTIYPFEISFATTSPNAEVKIRNLGNQATIDDIEIFCAPVCTPPTTSATVLTVNNGTISSLDLNFTRGNGDGVLIIAKAGATPAAAPTSGTVYAVNDAIDGGTVVYKGTADGINTATVQTIGSLLEGTQYQFSVYEYVGTTTPCYQAVALTGNGTTLYREIDVRGNSVSIVNNDATPSLTDHTDFGSTAITGGTVVRTFTIQNTGTTGLDISTLTSSNTTEFAIGGISLPTTIAANSSTTFTVTFDPSALGNRTSTITIGNNDANENPYAFAVQGTGVNSNSSDIVADGTFIYTSNINYAAFQSATIPTVSDGVAAFRFTIRDGGGASDSDALGTELTGITFNVANIANIRTARLYDGTTLISSTPTLAGTIAFTGLSGTNVTAPDNGTKTLTLYISFNTTVTDNDQLQFTVASTATNTSGSAFAAGNAGGATSVITGDINRIEVTADRLAFGTQPASTSINTNLAPFTLRFVDANGNLDFDTNRSVILTATDGGVNMTASASYSITAPHAGLITVSNVQFTSGPQTAITITGTTTGLAFDNDDKSSSFNVSTVVYTTNDYRTVTGGTWSTQNTGTATWQNWNGSAWVSSGRPTTSASNVYIRHTVTSNGLTTVASIIVEGANTGEGTPGGIYNLGHVTTINSKLLVEEGGTMEVTATLTNSGTFEIKDNGTFTLNYLATNLSTIWNGTEIFHPNSNFIIKEWGINSTNDGRRTLFNGTNISTNSYNGYTAAFGNLTINGSTSGENGSFILLTGGINANLAHGNLNLISPMMGGSSGNINILGTGGTTVSGIGGNFIVDDLYSSLRKVIFSTSAAIDFTIKGNLQLDGSTTNITTATSATAFTITVDGNLNITAGAVLDYIGSTTANPIINFNLKGNLSITSTGLLRGQSSGANYNFNFSNSSVPAIIQTIDAVSTSTNNRLNFNIKPSAYVKLINRNFGLGENSKLTVETGGTLDFGFDGTTPLTVGISGSQTGTAFESQAGSILKITSPNGITTAAPGATAGNVQVTAANRTFTALGDFHYIGKNAQATGNALPTNVRNLLVHNEGATNNLTITNANVNVNGLLTMEQGNIVSTASNLLSIGANTTTGKGTLSRTSGVVKGTTNGNGVVRRYFNGTNANETTGLFPLGTLLNQERFITLEYSSAAATGGYIDALFTETDMGDAGVTSLSSIPAVTGCPAFTVLNTDENLFWTLTPQGGTLTDGTYKVSLRKESTTGVCKQTVLKRETTNWLNPGEHLPGDDLTLEGDIVARRQGMTGTLKDFGLGNGYCSTTPIVYNGSWPSPPTKYDAVLIENNLALTPGNNLQVCECVVADNATVTVEDGATFEIINELTVEAGSDLIIEDGGSLVQVTDVINATANNNTGNIQMERITKPMYRYDFTYWSSPVFANDDQSDDAASVLNGTEFNLKKLSPMTLFDKYYKWGHDATTPAWQTIPVGAESMVPGRGYIVRAPQTYGTDPADPDSYAAYTADFIGVPNNGIVRHDVSGPGVWNLLGNPYPSAISADAFFDANVGPGLGSTNTLEGSIYIWTHNSEITETGTTGIYTYSNSDYACYNGTGSTDTKEADSDPTPGDPEDNKPKGYIAAGQSFFIKGTAGGEAVFNNGMRVAGENNQFFRPAPTEPLNNWETSGKHRVWLNMKGQTKGFNQLLVGYIGNATNEWDTRFDGESFGGNQVTFYSLLENKKLTIQGRALPFNNQDEVPLGYKSTLNGTLTISIDEYDGLFEGQGIYLEDKVLNIVHDLKASAYNFTTIVGTFNDRFVLRYLPSEELSNPDHENIANGLIVYQEENKIMIKSQLEALEQVTVYDLLGRIIFDKSTIGKNEFSIENVVMNEQPLIIKVKLANGQIVNKKIVY